jgi:hypothetical protein
LIPFLVNELPKPATLTHRVTSSTAKPRLDSALLLPDDHLILLEAKHWNYIIIHYRPPYIQKIIIDSILLVL